jgi:hypothetical protein
MMNDLPETLDRLAARLETLERRVYVLEHPAGVSGPLVAAESSPSPAAEAGQTSPFALAGGAFSVLGKAMLGIAGAYLLRAVAESTSLPKSAVAALAIAYAIMWLVWATHVSAGAWFARATYACTSALILAPMLWELTLRFKVLPAAVTAAALGAFVCAATALAWKRNLASIFWVGNVTAAAVALTLSIATRQMAPFVAVLLFMVLLCEYAAGRNRELSVRPLVALAADLGVGILIYIYSSPQSTRADYPVIRTAALLAPEFALFLIYGASVIFKTAVSRKTITVFETVQMMIVFLLAASGLLYFGPPAGTTVLGAFCLALSAASYAAAFTFFDRAPERRNSQVYAAWSAALFLAGCWLCLPPSWVAACLGVAAIVATVLGARLNRVTLEFHGTVYLLAAAAVSGLLGYSFRALAGSPSGAPAWSACLVSVCAALCYAAGRPCRGESWKRQLLPAVSAALAIVSAAAMLVEGLMALVAFSVVPGAPHLAFIRTLILCATALALAFSGSHWRRAELTRIGYAALALIAAKLILEDLRCGRLEFIAASIFLFAVTLIAVPHIARMAPRA